MLNTHTEKQPLTFRNLEVNPSKTEANVCVINGKTILQKYFVSKIGFPPHCFVTERIPNFVYNSGSFNALDMQ